MWHTVANHIVQDFIINRWEKSSPQFSWLTWIWSKNKNVERKNVENINVETEMRVEGEGVRVRVRVRAISSSIYFYFSPFYLLTYVLFLFSIFFIFDIFTFGVIQVNPIYNKYNLFNTLDIVYRPFQHLLFAQEYSTRYGMTTYVAFGSIGLLFNMAIFSQSVAHRRKLCSLYLLSMSCCSLIGLDSAIWPIIYALDHSNLLADSLVWSKIQYYFHHAFNQIMWTFCVLVWADRYAISRNQAYIRSFNRYYVSIRIIPTVIFSWLLLMIIFPTMLYSIVNSVCAPMDDLFDILYSVYILSFSVFYHSSVLSLVDN